MTTRIALIGAGFISDFHARGLQAQPNVEIVAVVSKNIDNARKFALKYNIKEALNDIKPLLTKEDLDAVIISTPNQFHAPYAVAFLQNGKDVFLEKPMGMNPKEGHQIQEVAKTNDGLVMVGHMWRFDVDTHYIKSAIDEGKLGKIFKTKGYGVHENWGPGGWFTNKKMSGGGALADMGVHAIDTARYLLGDPKPSKVYARISTRFGDYDVDDTGIIVITWDNGAESIIESGWWHPHMDGPEASTGIYGTKGYASLFPTMLKLTTGVESSEEIVPNLPVRESHCDQIIYTKQMEHFVNCIQTRSTPIPGFTEGQVVLDIVNAAYLSSETGEVINL